MHGMDGTTVSKKECITSDPRRSGSVTRYHTWPRIKEQTVAEHSWNVQRILLSIYPEAPRHLIVHAMVHDLGEVYTGDIPFPVKLRNPELKKIMDDMETSAHLRMCFTWGVPAPIQLSELDKKIFKCADYIEMWEWAMDELSLGNRMAEPVFHRCLDEIEKLNSQVPDDVSKRMRRYLSRRAKTYGPYALSTQSL